MATPTGPGRTLESVVALYRRSAGLVPPGAEAELEVRFQGVDLPVFATVLGALAAGEFATAGEGTIAQTVSAIMRESPAAGRRERPAGPPGASLVRQVFFADGARAGAERNYRKWPLAPPLRARNPHALDYTVVLSGEQDLGGPFTSDSSALIRVKCRASFDLAGAGAAGWRADLTVARQLSGADAQAALPGIVAAMFRGGGAGAPPMTPANMLARLGLAGAEPAAAGLYGFEIELEHLPGAADRDAVRPSEVAALAARVLRLARPEYVEAAAFQDELFHVAGLAVEAPGLRRRFEHEWGLKRLAPQVAALTRGEYAAVYPPTGYFLLDKADGVRALASVRDGRLRILADTLREVYAPGFGPPGAAAPPPGAPRADAARVEPATVVDGELVRGAGGAGGEGGGADVFYGFDVVAVLGENLARLGYEDRVARLAEAVGVLCDFGVDARAKPVVRLTAAEPDALRAQFESPALAGRPYVTDGRILVAPGAPYRDTRAYKWKPMRDTTIDFLARRAPPAALGRPPFADAPGHELYFLFVGINPGLFDAIGLERVPGYRDLFGDPARAAPRGGGPPGRGGRDGGAPYFPIQFAPSDAPLAFLYQHPRERPAGAAAWVPALDGKIVELHREMGEDSASAGAGAGAGVPVPVDWRLVRVREDRARDAASGQYFGNDFRVAELTWLNYGDPFDEAQLWEGPARGYFAAEKPRMFRAQTAFTSFVKGARIAAVAGRAGWVVDAAVGKGQDLGRYTRAGVRHLVGIDLDRGALSELVRRKYSHAAAAGRGARPRPLTLFALRADLTEPHAATAARVRAIAGFPGGPGGAGGAAGADALVSNLAVHYFAGAAAGLANFAALCRDLVKAGGTVVVTTLVGARVHALFEAKGIALGQSWDARQDGALKFSLRRGYADAGLTAAGQRIGVLLPFSGGAYYDEFLVNVDTLAAAFAARGFALVEAPGFGTHLADFRARNPAEAQALTPDDLTYLGLYGEAVFRREE